MISNTEAQELHECIGQSLYHIEEGTNGDGTTERLTRALELASIVVSDTEGGRSPDPQPIHVYFTGDEEGPDRFGIVYDTEDEALECAHENDLKIWRVMVTPDWESATLVGDGDE